MLPISIWLDLIKAFLGRYQFHQRTRVLIHHRVDKSPRLPYSAVSITTIDGRHETQILTQMREVTPTAMIAARIFGEYTSNAEVSCPRRSDDSRALRTYSRCSRVVGSVDVSSDSFRRPICDILIVSCMSDAVASFNDHTLQLSSHPRKSETAVKPIHRRLKSAIHDEAVRLALARVVQSRFFQLV